MGALIFHCLIAARVVSHISHPTTTPKLARFNLSLAIVIRLQLLRNLISVTFLILQLIE